MEYAQLLMASRHRSYRIVKSKFQNAMEEADEAIDALEASAAKRNDFENERLQESDAECLFSGADLTPFFEEVRKWSLSLWGGISDSRTGARLRTPSNNLSDAMWSHIHHRE